MVDLSIISRHGTLGGEPGSSLTSGKEDVFVDCGRNPRVEVNRFLVKRGGVQGGGAAALLSPTSQELRLFPAQSHRLTGTLMLKLA